jgi:tetratricopeptide (TPR) repeat protein
LQSLNQCELRVHACAPTNVAVCELARRSLSAFVAQGAVGTGASKRLADFLIMGTDKRLSVKEDDPLQQILFDGRVKRLTVACGWVQEHVPQLLGAMRAYTSHLREERAAAAEGASNSEAAQLASTELHSKITISAKILHAALQVLSDEAPPGAVHGLHHKGARLLLGHLTTVQLLTMEELALWEGLNNAAADVSNNGRVKVVNAAFAAVYAKLKSLTVKRDKLSKLEVLEAASLVFSTVNVGGRDIFSLVHFDVAVVDEATQLLQGETAIVLRRKLRCIVLAGDDKQLPATVLSPRCAKLGYGESLFSRLLKCKYPYVLLNTQYRMHPAISRWPRVQFYNGDVVDGPNVLSPAYAKDWHASFPPLAVFDLAAGREETHEHGSKFNEAEAILVRQIVSKLRALATPLTVGVITPYKAQITQLAHLSDARAASGGGAVSVRVNTVDSFQGQECDVIIFSTVRSNTDSKIGFLRDERRLNVAITRAKYALIIVCSVDTLSSNSVWASLFEHARRQKCLFDADTSKVIKSSAQKYEKGEDRISKLNYEDLFEEATWHVLFSSDFRSALVKISDQTKRHLFKKALGLAHGEWPKFELVDASVPDKLRGVLHVHRVLEYRLLWSVDIDRNKHEQCLRFWNVVQEAEVAQAVRRVAVVLNTYSDAYLERCAQKENIPGKSNRGANVSHDPVRWTPDKDFVWLHKGGSAAAADATGDPGLERGSIATSAVLTKFYELNSSVARLFTSSNSFAAIELPFKMSDREEAIVRHDGSVLVLGRSGTGKTTVILHRMFLLSEHNRLIEGGGSAAVARGPLVACRQLLVTASPILCEAIRRSYRNMCHTSAQLAGTLAKSGAPALNAAEQLSTHAGGGADSVAARGTFEECKSSDFPLILTYMSFLKMLDVSLEDPFFYSEDPAGNEVTFVRFATNYFPRFSAEVSKQADAALVYTEIMSHIKGSHAALHTGDGRLSKEDYLSLADSRGASLDRVQRAMLYDVYERYEKMKAQLYPGDYDCLDVVHHVYRALSQTGAVFRGALMTSVSVDEVQDLVPAQIVLFKFVCTDPAGFVFAGDTAQTIAHGVGFRFETLKDIFYQEFLSGYTDAAERVPEVTHLSENFRTHTGVVSIANSVVQLVTEFFPWSIDKLEPERSLVVGPAPLFISSEEDMVTELFGGDSACEFGPEQVILVRDEETKRQVLQLSGTRALVLTVQECKGMEFTDCLVYNFFSSSPLKNDWRVLYKVVNPAQPHPLFNENKHSALCVELKFLYVLLTRARQRLIIYDGDIKSREPMLKYWRTEQLVEEKPLDQDIRNLFLTESDPEQWQERGKQLFERQNYSDARMCYQRAGDVFHEQLCSAAELELEGDKAAASSLPGARALYARAAEAYLALAGYKGKAARCFELAEDFAVAARHFTDIARHRDAGRCFERAVMWAEAAHAYDTVNDVENALRCCYEPRDYERGRAMLDSFRVRQLVTEADHAARLEECAKKAALHFHSQKKLVKMMEFVTLFRDMNEKRMFLKRYKHFDLLLEIEISGHCFAPAARIYEETYDFVNAKTFYEKAAMPVDAVRCLVKSVRLEHLDDRFIIAALPISARDQIEEARTAVAVLPASVQTTHTRMAELLRLLPSIEAGKTNSAALQANLADLTSKLAKLGVEAVWPVYFNALVVQLRLTLSINEGFSPEVCQDCNVLCQELRRLADFVVPALGTMTADRPKPLSSSHNRILQQCLEFFEFKAAAYITASTQVECLRRVKGLAGVFNIAVESAPASRTVSVGIKEFCQCAHKYFKSEVTAWVRKCGEACEKTFKTLPVPMTLGQRATLLLTPPKDRKAIAAATKQRFSLLCSQHRSLAAETELQVGANELQKVAAERKLKQHSVLAALMGILLPADPLLQDVWDLGAIRTKEPALLSDLVTNYHATQAMRQPGLKYDEYARALLSAELVGSAIATTTTRLRGVLQSEIAKEPNPVKVERPRLVLWNLVESFAWENVSAVASAPIPEGPFYYGIQCLANCIIADIEKRGGGANAIMYNGDINTRTRCFPPSIFLKLTRKCAVALLLHWKSFRDVLLPTSLAVDQLVRRSGAYERAVHEYKVEGFPRSQLVRDRSWAARVQLQSLVSVLFYLLDKLTATNFQRWHEFEAGVEPLSARASKVQKAAHEEASRDARNSFVSGIMELAVMYLANTGREDYIRLKFCRRIDRLADSNNKASLVHILPFHTNKLMTKLKAPLDLNGAVSAFYQDTCDPLLLVNCTHSCPATIPARYRIFKPTRNILEASGGAVQLVPHIPPAEVAWDDAAQEEEAVASERGEPSGDVNDEAEEHVAVAAPLELTQEDRLAKCYDAARRWAQRARYRLLSLTPLDVLMRHVEREFVHVAASIAAAGVASCASATAALTDVATEVVDLAEPSRVGSELALDVVAVGEQPPSTVLTQEGAPLEEAALNTSRVATALTGIEGRQSLDLRRWGAAAKRYKTEVCPVYLDILAALERLSTLVQKLKTGVRNCDAI